MVSVTSFTPIPEEFKWIRATSTLEERKKCIRWVHSVADAVQHTDPDPDERKRLLLWMNFICTPIVRHPEPMDPAYRSFLQWGHSTPTKEVPGEHKRLFKWAHFTAKKSAPAERKRWSLQEEILKSFETPLAAIQVEIDEYQKNFKLEGHKEQYGSRTHTDKYPSVNQEHIIYTSKRKPGLYECRNAVWIWTKHLYFPGLPSTEFERGPVYFGEKIKNNFLGSDMIKGRPSVNDLGFVTIELSGKWIAESIHKMLKNGLHAWAPKLSVKRVAVVDNTSLGGRTNLNLARQLAIGDTLKAILGFSNVVVLANLIPDWPIDRNAMLAQFRRWFLLEEREGDVLIKGPIPFILPKSDFENAYKDIFALWYYEQKTEWIVYITPVQQRAVIEMCLAAAELEDCHPIGTRTSCAGYHSCNNDAPEDDLLRKARIRLGIPDIPAGYQSCNDDALKDDLLDKARIRLDAAAALLGYSADAVLECALKYTSLKIPRVSVCMFDIDEMLNEEGDTFVYLLNTLAKLRGITKDYRNDINEVKEASKLKLEEDKGWEEGEERMLGLHLLEFTEALEESCLSLLPHILCEYVYDLSQKFNTYHSSVCKDGFVAKTSTLLLYEATAVVMQQCFQLLGIIPTSKFFTPESVAQPPSDLFLAVERPMDVIARDPQRNSLFQTFSFRTGPVSHIGFDENGKVFGLISVSDKRGLLTGGGSQFLQPGYAHVPIFNTDWLNPVDMYDRHLVFLSAPSVPLSSFSSSISVLMELYLIKDQECYQVCNENKMIDLSGFWGKESNGQCGCVSVTVKEGTTHMYYILLKDAVDAALEVTFGTTNNPGREVSGYVLAYYGDELLWEYQSGPAKCNYYSLLFLSKHSHPLPVGRISLIKSQLAVPITGCLIVKAYLEDIYSGEVIMNDSSKFKAQLRGCSHDFISGSDGCSLNVKVHWNYQDTYL